MRYIKTILGLLMILFCSPAFSQDTTGTAKSAKIYFIRNTGYNGSALIFHCFVDTQLVCNLKNKKFSVHNINEGTHSFTVRAYSKTLGTKDNSISITAQAGKTYYIKLLPVKAYTFPGSINLLEISESTASPTLKSTKEETNCLEQ